MERRAEDLRSSRSASTVDPRTSLALWLRTGRTQRKLSLDDVARITKIQPRILEKLEAGCFEGLPAEVFVKGFVRSVARCVGLDEQEALERYGACNGITTAAPVARALVETMSELAPMAASVARKLEATPPNPLPVVAAIPAEPVVLASEPEPVVDEPVVEAPVIETVSEAVIEAVAPETASKKKRSRKKAAGTGAPRNRKKKSAETVEVAVVAEPAEPVVEPIAEPVVEAAAEPVVPEPPVVVETPAIEVVDLTAAPDPEPPWQPTMPPVVPSVPWKRPSFVAGAKKTPAFTAPTLSIDDADPESADLEREARESLKAPNRVSFLPPILLDRDDKSTRQGGLTLAVIILLIAATLTLSYLMRRPSLSGDGVTLTETRAAVSQLS